MKLNMSVSSDERFPNKEKLCENADNDECCTTPHPYFKGVYYTNKTLKDLYEMSEEDLIKEFPPDYEAYSEEIKLLGDKNSFCSIKNCPNDHKGCEPKEFKSSVTCTVVDCEEHRLNTIHSKVTEMSAYENILMHTPKMTDLLNTPYEDVKKMFEKLPINNVEFSKTLDEDKDFLPLKLYQQRALYGDPSLTNTSDGPYTCPYCRNWFTNEDMKKRFESAFRSQASS